MVAPISRSMVSNTYALRVLTDIATRLKASSPLAQESVSNLPSTDIDPWRNASAAITRIMLDARFRVPDPQTPVEITAETRTTSKYGGLAEIASTVLIDPEDGSGPHLERRTFQYISTGYEKSVVLLKDAKGTTGVTTVGPTHSVTASTGTFAGRSEDLEAMVVYNTRSNTLTWAADHDVALVKGSSDDDFIGIATSGSVTSISAGEDNDSIAILAGPKVDYVDGGDGDDLFYIKASQVDRLTGGAGNDEFRIYSHADFRFYSPGHGSVSRLDGGDGDDTIRVGFERALTGDMYDISGGDGDDSIDVFAATARNIAGGDGDDRIGVAGATIENVSGGRGDDHMTLYNTRGGVSTIDLHEGDGNDTVEVNGPLEIRRFNADGMLHDFSTAAVSTNEDDSITIRFAGSDDSVTVRYSGIAFGFDLQPTAEGALSITFRSVYRQSA